MNRGGGLEAKSIELNKNRNGTYLDEMLYSLFICLLVILFILLSFISEYTSQSNH